jgi:uncharacterized protein
MKRIERSVYLSKLIAFKDKEVIKVITGIRRCGKSTLMAMYRDWLRQTGIEDSQIVYINFEDYEFFELRSAMKLYQYVKPLIQSDRMTYLFFDEIQNVQDFPDVVNSLNLSPFTDIYITGSNAYMLSAEIATMLSGRYVEIAMLPLSFREYVSGAADAGNLQQVYNDYTTRSSFPYTLDLPDASTVTEYLNSVYDTIIVKDIVTRKKIQDVMMLESIARFAADNIGNTLSTKRISDIMTAEGRKIDTKTVERYMTALTESFFVYQAKRYDIKGRQLLKTLGKYYLVDVGLRRMLLGSRSYDAGRILENVVYLELLRRYREVYIGKVNNLEVDFVAVNSEGLAYFQVAASVREESTLQRELASLEAINDQYPKFVLTLDEDPSADYNGIKRLNAIEWLLS